MTPRDQSSPETQEQRPRTDTQRLLQATYRVDPALSPSERETIFRFAADDDAVAFFTEEPGIGRRLIAHPHTTVSAVRVLQAGATHRKRPTEYEEGDIVAVRGEAPVGVLKVGKSPRTTGGPAEVVSKDVLTEVDRP